MKTAAQITEAQRRCEMQAADAQFGRFPAESMSAAPGRSGPVTDLAELFSPDNPTRAATRAAILAALAAGALTHHDLHRALEPGALPTGFFPLALDDLIQTGQVRSEPGAGGGLPILILTEEARP